MHETALFPFIDPAVQVIVVCAAMLVLLFFLSSLSDALRIRERRLRRSGNADPVTYADSIEKSAGRA